MYSDHALPNLSALSLGASTGAPAGKGRGGQSSKHIAAATPRASGKGKTGPFAVEYSFFDQDEAREVWWRNIKAASRKSIYRTRLTKLVDQYIRGSYKAEDGKWYSSNTPEHRAAALLFYNKFIASDMPKDKRPTLLEWPDMYETGMWRLGAF